MLTLNTILEELKNVPVNRLKDLYSIIHSLGVDTDKTEKSSKKILSFAGSFSDMSDNDFNDFLQETQKNREELFDRQVNI